MTLLSPYNFQRSVVTFNSEIFKSYDILKDGGHQSPRSKMFDTESYIKTSHSSPSTIKGKFDKESGLGQEIFIKCFKISLW